MNTELTERYIRATIAGLPPAAQEDVRAELTALIMDATEARIDRGADPVSAERAALTELGDPAILTAEYADRPLHLIGPRHYLAWRRLLRLLLWIVPACAVAGVAIGQALVQAPLGTVIGQAIAVGIGAVLWDQLRGFLHIDGERLPFLNPELWPTWIVGLLGLLLLEAVLAVVVMLRRRWSPALATVNTALAVLFMSWALTPLGRSALVNEEFVDLALRSNGVDGETLRTLHVIVVITIIGASVWDIIDGWRKARLDAQG